MSKIVAVNLKVKKYEAFKTISAFLTKSADCRLIGKGLKSL